MNIPPPALKPDNNRILVIDDNPAIHEDFRKILDPANTHLAGRLDAAEAALFGRTDSASTWSFQIDSAFQGQEGLEKVRAAAAAGKPYAVAFVDVRMPPGWDGIETIGHIWKEFPDLQIVICTAYSDYSWSDIAKAIGETDHVLVLKKPFDNVEAVQMAHALTKKWQLTQIAKRQMEELEELVDQRTAELRQTNRDLTAEVAEHSAADLLLRCSEERFSKAFHGNPVPMAIQRADNVGFLDANASFLEILGASREAVLGGDRPIWADAKTAAELATELSAHSPVRKFAARLRTYSGKIRPVLVAAENLELGSEPYHLLILQDAAERTPLVPNLKSIRTVDAEGFLGSEGF